VFEASSGLVLADAGYTPAGPALRGALRSISLPRVHTVIYTHHLIYHLVGTWAFFEAGEKSEIITTVELVDEVNRDITSRDPTSRRDKGIDYSVTPHHRLQIYRCRRASFVVVSNSQSAMIDLC